MNSLKALHWLMFSNLTLHCLCGLMPAEICGCWTDSVETSADLFNVFNYLTLIAAIQHLFISIEIITVIVIIINCLNVLAQNDKYIDQVQYS